jgi:hypothetical protein
MHVAVDMLPVHREQRALLLEGLDDLRIGVQIERPPKSGSEEANLPSPITGRRMSSSFMP